jgi:hypothetical protein
MPLKTTPSDVSRKIPLYRIFSIAALVISICALVLAMKKPRPVAAPQSRTVMAANAQSFQTKVNQLAQAQAQGEGGSEVHLTANEIQAAMAQASGSLPDVQAEGRDPQQVVGQASELLVSAGAGSADQASGQEPIVSFEGDLMKGQFVTQAAGKNVVVTMVGHLASKDGYATFEPTEFKIGDLNVPVSLVNDALQKKMLEQRDRLKLPDYVRDLKVENGEVVIKQK